MRATSTCGLTLVLAALLAACNRTEHPQADDASFPVAPVLMGCAALQDHACTGPPPGPPTHCEQTRRPSEATNATGDEAFVLTVWVADGRADDELWIDDGRPPMRGDAVHGGRRFDVVVSSSARTLALVREGTTRVHWTLAEADPEPAPVTAARWARTLQVDDPRRQPRIDDLHAVMHDLGDDDRSTALDIAADLRFQAATTAEPADRPRAWRDALAISAEAHELARARGDEARARCHARRGLFVALEHLGDPAQIERWRAALGPGEDPTQPVSPGDAYYRGLLAQRIGDLQDAAAEYRDAEASAARWGDRLLATAAAQQLAAVLASLGRDQDVALALRRAEAAAARVDCRAWLRLLNNAAWSRVLLVDLGRPAEDPIPDLVNALAILDGADDVEDECHDEVLAEHVRLNLALAAATAGWTGYAEDLRAGLPPTTAAAIGTATWRAELDRRLALARRDHATLIEWLTTHASPPPSATAEQQWWWAWGRGEVLEALAAPDDALAAYEEAERVLAAMVLALDFDAGRDRLLLGYQRSAGRRVDLLVARGQPELALCAARLARARTSRILDRSARIGALSEAGRRDWMATITRYEEIRRALDGLRSV